MKRILTENTNTQVVEDEKRAQLSQLFRNAPFQDLVKKTQPKVCLFVFFQLFISIYTSCKHFILIVEISSLQHEVLQSKLSEIFNALMIEPRNQSIPGGTPSDAKPSQIPAYEIHFPELFVY